MQVQWADDLGVFDPRLLYRLREACQRCHIEQTLDVRSARERQYYPPEGVAVTMPSANGTHIETPSVAPGEEERRDWDKTCVRPGTREHGVMRDGSRPVRTACGHLLKDHGEVRYFGNGRYRWVAGKCKDCSCEGFLG